MEKNNMKRLELRIRKITRYDKHGKVEYMVYYVQRKKSILGIGYWKAITHLEGSFADTWKTRTEFLDFDKAKQFCQRLQDGVRANSKTDYVVEYV
jgi:hypothetical protein